MFLILSLVAFIFLAAVSLGAAVGLSAGQNARAVVQTGLTLQEQFSLAQQDLTEGRYEVARQRFEHIINQEPTYPGAADGLALALQVIYATATPTPPAATVTPTPTRDPRPSQEQFDQARGLLAAEDWSGAIDRLITLRKEDPTFETARVDGMLFLALRHRGVHKILVAADLQGGIYDLALAERFGPLDGQAHSTRNLARLYLFGSSFWEAYPEQAVFYFQQAAAAAPGLRDASGITALERYWGALIQYGDQLMAAEDPCLAQAQYELAQTIRSDAALEAKLLAAVEACTPPTATPGDTETPTVTPTFTETPAAGTPSVGAPSATAPPAGVTPSPTQPAPSTPTPTTPPATVTQPPAASDTPTPSPTPETPAPSDTAAPPTEAPPTEAPPTEPAATAAQAPTSEAAVTEDAPAATAEGLTSTPTSQAGFFSAATQPDVIASERSERSNLLFHVFGDGFRAGSTPAAHTNMGGERLVVWTLATATSAQASGETPNA